MISKSVGSLRARSRAWLLGAGSIVLFGPSLFLMQSDLSPALAQSAEQSRRTHLPRIQVTTKKKKAARRGAEPAQRGRNPLPAPMPPLSPSETARSPLNTNMVAESASRLGLTPRQSPASVEVVDQQAMRELGVRTTAEAANAATGVLAVDVAGAPANFSMRGFSFGEVNVLYNGISTGPASISARTMDTANLSQIEFLKGPSALMSGLNAIGGSVNYVSRQPTSGPIRSELDVSVDSLGSTRTHYGSGGSTALPGLDYRFDVAGSRVNGFINDSDRDLTNIAAQLDYRANSSFKMFAAIEYKRDEGRAYWGTPLVPTSSAGSNAVRGVVSGSAVSTFDGSTIAPVTIDRRTLKTNYNVLDNSTAAEELWVRSGFVWTPYTDLTVKNQSYYYQARRHWLDSETYAFNGTTNTIDRDRFFVGHDQRLVGNNTDVVWDTRLFGLENRAALGLQMSRNWLTFSQHAGGFPQDTVDIFSPDRGTYGDLQPDKIGKRLDTLAVSVEDRLKLTNWLSLIGGLRYEHFALSSDRVNFDGTSPPASFFTKAWNPVSYRAGVTFEPIRNLMFYAMTATAYDPAAAGIFSIRPGTSLELTEARIYETGVKHLFWDNRAEWTFSAYDITRHNVYVALTNAITTLAGEVNTRGLEFAAAVRPFDGWKFWGNVAVTESRYKDFDVFTGNTPSNVAPLIINAGGSYRWNKWRWPVEVGAQVRHVGRRYLFEDDTTVMEPYTTADLFAYIDIPGRDLDLPQLDKARVSFRVRNVTDKTYAAFSDPGYPDQIYLGAPRTYEIATSFRW
ncbi:TonB-dependent receptor family protein [Rhodoplanes sp. Z2-YC6860]|nr:TonB-dependent receptor family protein [Rhodoplanes sp. Z2-YC6860]